MHVGRPLFRGLRALVFALACAAVSAGLHVVADGGAVGAGPFAAAVAALAPVGFVFGGAQRGPLSLLALCGTAQAALHVWFSAGHLHHLMPEPSMLLVHLLAAAVSAAWLARGDAALAAFIDAVVLLLAAPPPLRGHTPQAPVRTGPPPSRTAAPVIEPLVSAVSLRGPPRPLRSH
ncbi:hypothetical protein LO763_08575 [Glycomyces sp. A-F 0318]|uniref:hypothetical protein n=1 Tax=Glycomyces amatae TaxID=2881355 RepID=UPI001E4FD497|nr:hypothetical protein [Glycomyces amatae]MCD0443676.1 hypothetical protein [Glycomyces amatae]